MAMSHKQLPINQVVAGMVLGEQVCNAAGTVLLVPGTVISEAILVSLQRHQIAALPILFEQVESEVDQHAIEQQCERIAHLFRKHDVDDASGHLKALLLRYRAGETA